MSSSISSSEPDAWRRFVRVFLLVGLGALAGLVGLELVVDPYDRGLFGGDVRGVPDFGPRFADASRARDPAFDGVILGNSHIQLVDPAALGRGSGIAFVSLIVPGTGPREQLAILDDVLRRRLRPLRALVAGLDGTWCTDDPALPITNPFPFWLYDPGPWASAPGLLRYSALEHLGRTLALRAGVGVRARPDGFWDYAQDRPHREGGPAIRLEDRVDTTPLNETGRYPALDRLAERLGAMPAGAAMVLVRPPVYHSALPASGSPLGRSEAECRAAMARLAAGRPGAVLIDARADGSEARDPAQWFDQTHYKEPVARRLEADIVEAIGFRPPP